MNDNRAHTDEIDPDPIVQNNEAVKDTMYKKRTHKNKDPNAEPPMTRKEEIADFAKTALVAVLIAVLIRTFLYEPFNIPSGSMKPTLLVGDYLFVSKPVYGYSRHSFPFSFAPIEGRIWSGEPKRGDVIVFKLPSNTKVDYIKRVVAMPGETVQVRNGRLYINGDIVPRTSEGMIKLDDEFLGDVTMERYVETLPGGIEHFIYEENDYGPLDNTRVYNVPEGHYFVMGDNRDNSQDSRVTEMVGSVPFENIVGRADILFFSVGSDAVLAKPWTWFTGIRYSRLFDLINPKQNDFSQDNLAQDATAGINQ